MGMRGLLLVYFSQPPPSVQHLCTNIASKSGDPSIKAVSLPALFPVRMTALYNEYKHNYEKKQLTAEMQRPFATSIHKITQEWKLSLSLCFVIQRCDTSSCNCEPGFIASSADDSDAFSHHLFIIS